MGAYRTDELQPYVLEVVKKAEKIMLDKGENKEYLPIQGLAAFNEATTNLLLGEGSPLLANDQVATVQSLSGTGSLRVGAAFIQKFMPGVSGAPPGRRRSPRPSSLTSATPSRSEGQ